MSMEHSSDYEKTAALITAIISQDIQKVNSLLNEGADPNGTLDSAEVTALHYAAQNNTLGAIPLLIQAGADTSVTTQPEEQTPLDIAIMHNHKQMIGLLISYITNPPEKIN